MKEFIEELEKNQKINYKNNLENRIDIDYVIDRLEEIQNEIEEDPIDYILRLINKLEKDNKYEVLIESFYNLYNDTQNEAIEEVKKDNKYHNVHLKGLLKELENLQNIINRLEV